MCVSCRVVSWRGRCIQEPPKPTLDPIVGQHGVGPDQSLQGHRQAAEGHGGAVVLGRALGAMKSELAQPAIDLVEADGLRQICRRDVGRVRQGLARQHRLQVTQVRISDRRAPVGQIVQHCASSMLPRSWARA